MVASIRILGPIEILADRETWRSVSRIKCRELLAELIAAEGRILSMEQLIQRIWGENPPASAGPNIRSYVKMLRTEYPLILTPALISHRPGYSLDLEVDELDATVFESRLRNGIKILREGNSRKAAEILESALSLWRGRPLTGVPESISVYLYCNRLNELRITAFEALFEALLRCGESDSLVSDLRIIVASHPLREVLRAQLMLALFESGRPSEATMTFHEYRNLLSADYGIDPRQNLNDLHRAIVGNNSPMGVYLTKMVTLPDHHAEAGPWRGERLYLK
jgi:DNA-binding SARP family transcriptional activator